MAPSAVADLDRMSVMYDDGTNGSSFKAKAHIFHSHIVTGQTRKRVRCSVERSEAYVRMSPRAEDASLTGTLAGERIRSDSRTGARMSPLSRQSHALWGAEPVTGALVLVEMLKIYGDGSRVRSLSSRTHRPSPSDTTDSSDRFR
jgi:hypothetical protein